MVKNVFQQFAIIFLQIIVWIFTERLYYGQFWWYFKQTCQIYGFRFN